MVTKEGEVNTSVCQTNPNMESTATSGNILEPYMGLSMKLAASILLTETSKIMMHRVSCAMSGHVAPS